MVRAFGYVNMAPWLVGLGLSQIGEFSFVLARAGVSSGLLSESTYDLALACTVLTMALSPLVSSLALPLGRRWRSWRKPASAPETSRLAEADLDRHVIIAGYGRSGKAAAHVLQKAGIPAIVVELDHAVFTGLASDGLPGVWGDITGERILAAARIQSARVLLLAVPDPSTVRLAIQRARQMSPLVTIVARAARPHHLAELRQWGVDAAVQPEFEGGVEMVRQALTHYRCEGVTAERLLSGIRQEFYAAAGAPATE